MKTQKKEHTHKFNIPTTQEVVLTSGLKTAKDTLKQWKCACGQVITYDLEREVK